MKKTIINASMPGVFRIYDVSEFNERTRFKIHKCEVCGKALNYSGDFIDFIDGKIRPVHKDCFVEYLEKGVSKTNKCCS